MKNWLYALVTNRFLIIGLTSWLWAQVLKTIIYAFMNKKLDLSRLVGDGGMPSGHSATVASLTTAALLCYGPGSFQFAISLILAVVVCKDAMGVRLETGKQAVMLNEMMRVFNVLTSSEQLPLSCMSWFYKREVPCGASARKGPFYSTASFVRQRIHLPRLK